MGWRISFGVGPLRYSAPLTSRRRTTRRYVQPADPRPPAQVKTDRVATLIGVAILVGALIAMVVVGLIIG